MAWSLETVRDTIATRIITNSSVKQTYATMPSVPILPCAIVSPTPGQFLEQTVMDDDTADLHFNVIVLVSNVVDDYAQNTLDGLVSQDAVRDAIDAGKVTNVWSYAITAGASGYGEYRFGDPQTGTGYLGFSIPVTVAVP